MLKYTQAYTMFKEMIADGRLRRGERMPSIRRAAELYRISRTTVQNAYFQLAAEGYIYAKPQSGYFVAGGPKAPAAPMPRPQVQTPPRLDLTGNSADLSSFDFSLWQRYIKSALRQRQRLLTYSEPQGEYDLRCALADYVRERRNVVTAPEHIVVGARGANAAGDPLRAVERATHRVLPGRQLCTGQHRVCRPRLHRAHPV